MQHLPKHYTRTTNTCKEDYIGQRLESCRFHHLSIQSRSALYIWLPCARSSRWLADTAQSDAISLHAHWLRSALQRARLLCLPCRRATPAAPASAVACNKRTGCPRRNTRLQARQSHPPGTGGGDLPVADRLLAAFPSVGARVGALVPASAASRAKAADICSSNQLKMVLHAVHWRTCQLLKAYRQHPVVRHALHAELHQQALSAQAGYAHHCLLTVCRWQTHIHWGPASRSSHPAGKGHRNPA